MTTLKNSDHVQISVLLMTPALFDSPEPTPCLIIRVNLSDYYAVLCTTMQEVMETASTLHELHLDIYANSFKDLMKLHAMKLYQFNVDSLAELHWIPVDMLKLA